MGAAGDRVRLRLVIGSLLLVLGVAWIAELQGYVLLPGGLGTWWPSLIVLWGVASFAKRPGLRVGPFFLVALGGLLQADRLGYLPTRWTAYLVPLLLVALGLSLLLSLRRHRRLHPGEPYRRSWGFRVGNLRPVERGDDDADPDALRRN